MLATSFQVSAVIFDLDGVLVDSRAAVDAAWLEWGSHHGLDPELVLRSFPGMRTRDAIVVLAPETDADVESARIIERELALVDRVRPIPGARALIERLPAGRWGIATSGTAAIARSRLTFAGLPIPDVFITAEMVRRGKPDPEVYQQAAARLGVAAAECVVFEDAPSGVAAAATAGGLVVGVLTWAAPGVLATPYAVQDLRAVRATPRARSIHFDLDEAAD